MADILDQLIKGNVPPDELIRALRGQVDYGTAASLSGSKTLAPVGAGFREDALAQAADYRATEDKKAAAAQENALEALKAKMAAAEKAADRAQRSAESAANRANMRGIAEMREAGAQKRATAKAQGKQPAEMTPDQLESTAAEYDNLANIAAEGIKRTGALSAGLGSVSKIVPGTPAYALEEFIAPLGSNLALQALADLKSKSATGASGLGSITEKEIDILMKRIVSLKTGQPPAQLRSALAEIQTMYAGLAAKLRKGQAELAQDMAEGGVEEQDEDEIEALMQQLLQDNPEFASEMEGFGG